MKDRLEILLVEDDAVTRASLCNTLERDGHRVRFACSLAEAKQQIEFSSVSLVILDRRLPDGVAEDFLPDLRRLLPDVFVIYVTGYADLDSTLAAFRHGVVDYILKPINPDALRQSIGRILRQRRTEAELLEEQRFANEILATADAIILVLDLAGIVQRFNPCFTRIAGWEHGDLCGHDWFEYCIPERDRIRVRSVFIASAHDVHSTGVLNPILTKGGRECQIRWSNTTLKDEAGEVKFVLAVGVDVTELVAAQEQAMRSERLAAIGQTMTGLAHESRNALQRIQASVEMLSLEIPETSESREDLQSIARAAKDLETLLEEVRSYSATIHLHRERTPLAELWRCAWGHLELSRQGRDAILDDGDGVCDGFCEGFVRVDIARMEQVFRNLFENSLAACSDPVQIRIRCKCDGPDAITIEIRDNGPGLSAEQKCKLFEPFYTTKSSGTGLGMSIVQRVIEAHDGDIRIVDSTTGACFEIRLLKQPFDGPRICCQDT